MHRGRWGPWAAGALLVCALTTAGEAPLRLAVYGEGAAAPLADLVMVQLAGMPGVAVFERERVAAVLKEHELLAGGSLAPAQSLRAGQLLNAAGVLLLLPERAALRPGAGPSPAIAGHGPPGTEEPPRFTARLMATAHGVVVWQQTAELPQDLAAYADALVEQFTPLLSKLRQPPGRLRRLSVAGLFTELANREHVAIGQELLLLLTHRLTREPSVLVLERDYLDKLLLEREFFAREEQAALLTGSYVLRGNLAVPDKDTVRLALTLTAPGQAGAEPLELTGRRDDLPALAEAAAARLFAALGAPAPTAWDRAAEAQFYARQAAWAAEHNVAETLAAAAESAWAFGLRDARTARLRLLGYCLAASPTWQRGRMTFSDGTTQWVPRGTAMRAVPDFTGRFRAALRALDLATDFARAYPDDYEFSDTAILSASRALRSWHEQERRTPVVPELAAVRESLRQTYATLRHLAEGRLSWSRDLDDCAIWYAGYWVEHPQDALPIYRALLERFLESRGPHPERVLNGEFGTFFPQSPRYVVQPLFVAWDDADERQLDACWLEFTALYAGRDDPLAQAASWLLRLLGRQGIAVYHVRRPNYRKLPSSWNPSKPDNGPLRDFVWQNREMLLADPRRRDLIVSLEPDAWSAADRQWRLDYLEYFLKAGRTLRSPPGGIGLENPDISVAKRDLLASLLDRFLALVPPERRSKDEKRAVADLERQIRFSPPGPRPVPPARPVLAVTQACHPYTIAAAGQPTLGTRLDLVSAVPSPALFDHASGQYLVFDPALTSFRTVRQDGLAMVPHGNNDVGTWVTVTAADYFLLTEQDTPVLYYQDGAQWRSCSPSLPVTRYYRGPVYRLGDRFYFASREEEGMVAKHSERHAAILQVDPVTARVEVLASTRRQQPRTPLDSLPLYWVWAFFRGEGEELLSVVSVEGDPNRVQRLYGYSPATSRWRVFGELPEFSTRMLEVPGGLLLLMGTEPAKYCLSGLALLSATDHRWHWLADSVVSPHDEAPWTIPADLYNDEYRNCGSGLVSYDGSSLHLLWLPCTGLVPYYELMIFRPGRRAPYRVPLVLSPSKELEAQVMQVEGSRPSNSRMECRSPRTPDANHLVYYSSQRGIGCTAKGLVIASDDRGYLWFVPWADVQEYLRKTAQEPVGD